MVYSRTYLLSHFGSVLFYELGKTTTSPSLEGVALCRRPRLPLCKLRALGIFGRAAGAGAFVSCREPQGQARALGLPWQTSWDYIQLKPAQASWGWASQGPC